MTQITTSEQSDLQIRVVRMKESQIGDVISCNKILVHVFLWTKLRGLKLELQDLEYKLDIVDLKLMFIHDPIDPFKNPFPTTCLFELGQNESDTKQEELKFNNTNNNVLLLTINNIPSDTRPTGTKRKVVIYEDTDILDSGDLPNPSSKDYG